MLYRFYVLALAVLGIRGGYLMGDAGVFDTEAKSVRGTDAVSMLMDGADLTQVDAARLVVEFIENSGLAGSPREDIIAEFRRVMRLGLEARALAERTVSFGEAVARSLEERKGRRTSTPCDLRSYTGRMLKYDGWAEKPLRSITVEDCRRMLQAVFGHSANAFKKARIILHSIFAFGIRLEWVDKNPVDAVAVPKVVEQRIEILCEREVKRLLRASKAPDMACMEAPLKLMLWGGIRPGEVRRLRWGDIDLQDKVVYVDPCHSKTGGARIVPMRGPLARLVRPEGAGDADLVAPANWTVLWRKLRDRAGLRAWKPDVLRHTFASMHLRYFADLPELQAEMGHRDTTLLRTRYVNLRGLTAGSAKVFWRM